MAQEKAPRTRARKTAATDEAAPAKKAPKRATKTAAAAPKKTAAPRPRRTKKVEPDHEAIALRAYALWERGEWGTPDELWLKAESELKAA
jgi:hypothetical protein